MKLSRSSGFSLLELLLAVAVIAVLASLIFSGMQGISERREEQVCMSNLRQVYVLLQAYVGDHGGRLPPASSDVDNDVTLHWRRAILPYMNLKAGGSGLNADVFRSHLICPTMNRSPRAEKSFAGLSNFGVNVNIGDPVAPLKRGIPMASIRNPARFFLATESIFKNDGLPRESIQPKDFNTYAKEWGYHRKSQSQHVLYGDGHIVQFENIRRLIMTPFAVGKKEDVWTP